MDAIYKFVELSNGDILLEKVIIDKNNYAIINKENNTILLKKMVNVTNIIDIKKYDFTHSSIVECVVHNAKVNKLKYTSILNQIYKIIDDGATIIKHTKMNIKTIKKEDEGFYYLESLGISVQGVDSNKCILEIMNQCIKNNITLILKIKLFGGLIVNIAI